jgi:hypothetical protein
VSHSDYYVFLECFLGRFYFYQENKEIIIGNT